MGDQASSVSIWNACAQHPEKGRWALDEDPLACSVAHAMLCLHAPLCVQRCGGCAARAAFCVKRCPCSVLLAVLCMERCALRAALAPRYETPIWAAFCKTMN